MDPAEDVKGAVPVANDFNHTVMIGVPETANVDSGAKPVGVKSEPQPKQDIEEFVKGVDINPYISSILDLSSTLHAPLEHVDSKFAMLEEFAHGGTASVWIARDRNLGRLVAVKSLNLDRGDREELLKTFVAEAKMTAQLDHPGIIPIYGLATDEKNGIHLVMKLVNGKTLREYLRNIAMNYRIRGIEAFEEGMMLRNRLELFLHICDTIAYAHHRDVVHRDLKPENIMIGKYREVFVMDWGIAKVVSGEKMVNFPSKSIFGTPRYFAPEVLRQEPLDKRSDIFTLGLILQEVVTLNYAVTGADETEYMAHILKGQIEPVEHQFHWKIDKYLKAIIQKAQAYRLEERYQTADELAEDLRRYLAHRSISARPENAFSRLLRRLFGYRL